LRAVVVGDFHFDFDGESLQGIGETMIDFEQIQNSDYHARAGIGPGQYITSSMVKAWARNPLWFRARYVDMTATFSGGGLKLGSMVHAMAAGQFQDEFAEMPECPHQRSGKALKSGAKFQEWISSVDLGGREGYSPAEYEDAHSTFQNMLAHEGNQCLHNAPGAVEGTLTGTLEGLPVQVRLDKFLPADPITGDAVPCIVDWKTTKDISRFRWQARDLGYHLQAAFYALVVGAHTGVMPRFYFAVVETQEPGTAGLWVMPDGVMQSAADTVGSHLRALGRAIDSGEYPNPYAGVSTLLICDD
jgi:hypothetical protein